MFKKTLLIWTLPFVMFTGTADATMRCGTSLISLGDTVSVVREKCGAPDSSVEQLPVMRSGSARPFNAAKVTLWVYGPRNGAYHHLRFLDDKLVAIDTRRN